MKTVSWRGILSWVILLLLIPAAMVISTRMDRKYYLFSLLIIFLTLGAFFLHFEQRKPQARELVVLAVLCALAVASRAAFAFIPYFKPMLAIVMLAGIAFGPEAGFMVGSIGAFASNFIFGQGMWTPWQMFAYGLSGLLLGLLVKWKVVSRSPGKFSQILKMSVIGFVTIVVIIGPLLDTSTLFMTTTVMTGSAAAAIYLSGLPVNLIHGSAVFLTLLLAGKPILEKLERIQVKYGMLEK